MIRRWIHPGRLAAAAITAAAVCVPAAASASMSQLPYDVGSILMLPDATPDAPQSRAARPFAHAPLTNPAPATTEIAASGRADRDGKVSVRDSGYWRGYLDNAWRMVSGPLRYDDGDWLNVGIVLGGAAGLLLVDGPLGNLWQDKVRGPLTDNPADVLNEVGDIRNYYVGAVGLFSAAEIMGWQREKAAALLTMQAVTLAIPVVGGMKYLIGRERPDVDNANPFSFRGPAKNDINASMISGHATYAFAAASVFSELYGETDPWVPWVGYGLATSMALARVNDDRHWLSDVFAGGAIGILIGKMVVRFSPFLEENDIAVLPFTASGAPGITLAYRY